jgi:hypothetical protein
MLIIRLNEYEGQHPVRVALAGNSKTFDEGFARISDRAEATISPGIKAAIVRMRGGKFLVGRHHVASITRVEGPNPLVAPAPWPECPPRHDGHPRSAAMRRAPGKPRTAVTV